MGGLRNDEERLQELRDTGAAIGALAGDADAFARTVEAFRAQDAERFQAELSAAALLDRCRLICRWLCSKHCAFVCTRLCGPVEAQDELDVEEVRKFAEVTARIAADDDLLRRLVEAVDREDVEAWRELVKKLKIGSFCHQLCHYLCSVKCRLVCTVMCPTVTITQVGNIPTSQIDPAGQAAGPSAEVGKTPVDDKPAGVGDHPFGSWENIRGAWSVAGASQYKVEYATTPTSLSWTPILSPVHDYRISATYPIPPFDFYDRTPTSDGWYLISEMGFDGPDYLTDWWTPTVADGLYYLKLTVRTGALVEFPSAVVPILIDNTVPVGPAPGGRPSITIKQGTKTLDCCETVKRDGGPLTITIEATDDNFSSLSVDLEGGCGAGYPIFSKTYNGDTTDTGAPSPGIDIVFDPWAAGVSPCCYVIFFRIWDRAILNNYYSGGHGNENWHSITIA